MKPPAGKLAKSSIGFRRRGTRLSSKTGGSSLTVEPAASLCVLAADAGARLIIVNADPTPYDRLAADVIRDPIGQAIPALVDGLLGPLTTALP